jgi:RNA polymerase sigma-70 factor (ECF subfamily)
LTQLPQADIDALVLRAQGGDTEAFGLVYDDLVKPVYRYIYYRVEDSIAEDLTEETFFKAWQNLRQFKPGKYPFSAWIFRIAHNLVIDHYRKNKSYDEIDEQIPDENLDRDPHRQTELKLTNVRLRKVIRKLPDSYQQIILLKYINELDNAEIASAIGKSEGAIRTLQSRALEKLRVLLGEENEEKV